MLASLSRLQALLLIGLIALLGALALTMGPPPPADPGEPITGTYSDVQLYTDIANAMDDGEGYYHAAIRLQRAHGFPTSPFVTVRPPTLAWIETALGWQGVRLLLGALLIATALVWFATLRRLTDARTRIAAAVLLLLGGAMAADPGLVVSHELWAGNLVALAMGLQVRGQHRGAMLAAACALSIRELALPFVLIAALDALLAGRRREVIGWAGIVLAFGIAMVLHRHAVTPLSLPGDAVSQGWGGLRGPGAVLRDVADVTLLHLLPLPAAYLLTLLAFFGFLAAPPPLARLALPWLAVVALLLAVFARPVNFYWAILSVPTVVAGLAFLPALCRDLAAALGKQPPRL